MRQNEERCTSIIVSGKEFGECVIGQVAYAAHDALLYDPWIRASAQHFKIVIGFDYHAVAAA